MKHYSKLIDGKTIIRKANEIIIRTTTEQIINPSEELILADGWEVYVAPVYVPTLEDVKARKVEEILAYDSSEAVNEFSIGGVPMWLDKLTRVGLRDRLISESTLGKTETTLWYNSQMFVVDIEKAKHMLILLENYASECYDNTQRHISEVLKLSTIEEVLAYDYAMGYPDKLAFEF